MKTAAKDKATPAPTWKPYTAAARSPLTTADKAVRPTAAVAFPRVRKEPMTDATHVRDALARFNQVADVTDAERELAFANFQKAARHFHIQMKETDWHQFGS